MKKILSVILVLSMVLALGVTAFADEVYGQESGVLIAGKSYPFTFSVDTSEGITLSDSNGILSFSAPVIGDGFVAVNVTAVAGNAGRITKIYVKTNNAEKKVLAEAYISVENPSTAGNGSSENSGILEVGKSYAFSFNVPTPDGIIINDSNGVLLFTNPVLANGVFAVNITPTAEASGKITKVVIKANNPAKTVLYEGYISVAVATGTTQTPTTTPSTTPSTGTTTKPATKPNSNTGANSMASAVVALAVMGAAAVVAKKVR